MSSGGSGRQRGFGTIGALDREWRQLVDLHRGTVITWADGHPFLSQCHSLDDVVSVAQSHPDVVLAALLTEVSAGDRLASRVVLQCLVGRIARMAQRDPRSGIDDYLAALWYVINNYPLSRRPVRIAANLSMDTLRALSRERSWPARLAVRLCPSTESLEELMEPARLDGSPFDAPPPVDLEARQVLEASSLLRLTDGSEAALLSSVYAAGLTGAQAARRLHTSAGTVRVRCSKVLRRLAAHAVELAEVA